MKKVEIRVSQSSISSVLDFQKLSIKEEKEEPQEISCQNEKIHKIITLPSSTSVVERLVLLESLSDDFGPPTPQRNNDGDDSDDATDVESELVDATPGVDTITPILKEYRPCDPVARFLLSKCYD